MVRLGGLGCLDRVQEHVVLTIIGRRCSVLGSPSLLHSVSQVARCLRLPLSFSRLSGGDWTLPAPPRPAPPRAGCDSERDREMAAFGEEVRPILKGRLERLCL